MTKSIVDLRMLPLKKRFSEHIPEGFTLWDNKRFITDTNSFGVCRGLLHNYTTMTIDCDAEKCQINCDSQAPSLATHPIHGIPNAQGFWIINPPFYISVNQMALIHLEIRVWTDKGDLVPFDPSGRLGVQLKFGRPRSILEILV